MKIFKKIAIIIVVLFVLVMLTKNFLIKSLITSVGSNVLGARVEIKGFSLGLFTQKIKIRDFKIYNPPGFTNDALINIQEVSVDFNVASIFKGTIHLPYIVFNLKEIIVVKNREGKLNVDALKVLHSQQTGGDKIQPVLKDSQPLAIQIDLMRLNIDQVIFKDFSKGGEQPVIQVYEGIHDKTFKDITSVQQLAMLIIVQGIAPTAIKSAAVYAAASFLGLSFFPASVVGALIGKDSAVSEFDHPYNKVYETVLMMIKKGGQIKTENQSTGIIKAKINGCDVTIKMEQLTKRKVQITISARQMLLPKAEIAQGILYQISQKLK